MRAKAAFSPPTVSHTGNPVRSQILDLARNLQEPNEKKGLTIIPLVVIEQAGKLKLKISVAQGKKTWDKKEALKEKDIKLQTKRELNK